mmetsp:Transcript_41992/g.89458  ORF Transcript_41992/g.89458 Transcript_41992/m.89458 type:complete len:205 (+) Transcript_41992:662-1276(+)
MSSLMLFYASCSRAASLGRLSRWRTQQQKALSLPGRPSTSITSRIRTRSTPPSRTYVRNAVASVANVMRPERSGSATCRCRPSAASTSRPRRLALWPTLRWPPHPPCPCPRPVTRVRRRQLGSGWRPARVSRASISLRRCTTPGKSRPWSSASLSAVPWPSPTALFAWPRWGISRVLSLMRGGRRRCGLGGARLGVAWALLPPT